MNKLIAKLIIAVMVVTSVITPTWNVFADTSEGQAVEAVTANETIAEEVVAEEMKFLYMEQQIVEAPGTQNIAIAWKDDIKAATKMLLVYDDGNGKEGEIEEFERTEDSILFKKDFNENETGAYYIKGIKYFVGETENYLALDDIEIDATFEVVNEVADEAVEDNIVTIPSTTGATDSEQAAVVEEQVATILEEAEAQASDKDNNVVVVLDPGHGGNDAGATRKLSDGTILTERDINLKIAKACYDELIKYAGIEVYMSRTTKGSSLSIREIVDYAASVNADILVSLHINAAVSDSASGAEVWAPNKNYNKTVYKEGQALSQNILDELLGLGLGLKDRGVQVSFSKDNTQYEDGSLADYYGIIRESKELGFTGIIVEHAFISNSKDRKVLMNDSNLKKLGIADANGIVKYLGLSKGKWVTTADGKKYKFTDGTYADGYIKIDSAYYYFDEKGLMKTGLIKIDGMPYYFSVKGRGLSKGWCTFKNGNKTYSKGGGKLLVGYNKIGKSYYFFNTNGIMKTGTQKVEGKPYFFKSDGKAATKGWLTIKKKTKKYCYGKGKLAVGYKKVGDYYYGFSTSGTMMKYKKIIAGKPYYFRSNGRGAGKGWIELKDGNKVYSKGKGVLATGVLKIGKKYYEFDETGKYIGRAKKKPYEISGTSTVTVKQMVAYYKANRGSKYPSAYKNTEASTIEKMCRIYYDECEAEGIKAEVAFCQAMKETGWLKYGGDVKIGQYNFAGIGATGNGNPGHSFDTVTIGVRAHVQHLKAYANNEPLVNECVDPRFKKVTRGAAQYVEWLGVGANPNGKGWAPAATYGTDIVKMINELKTY